MAFEKYMRLPPRQYPTPAEITSYSWHWVVEGPSMTVVKLRYKNLGFLIGGLQEARGAIIRVILRIKPLISKMIRAEVMHELLL
jgi:hypothetical protein